MALALGNNGQVAVYSGGESVSQTIFQGTSGTDVHGVPGNSNFPGPLAIDANGVLHQAIVTGAYQLNYQTRDANGNWTSSVVDNVPVSGHIDLKLAPDGNPVIVATPNSAGDSGILSIYELVNSVWQKTDIDASAIAQSLGYPSNFDLGGPKELVFDPAGDAYLAHPKRR